MNTTLLSNGTPRTRGRSRVNGHALVKVEAAKVEPTWQELLKNLNIGSMTRVVLQELIPHVIASTNTWAEEVKTMGKDSPKLPMKDRLKRFFSLNPFGCRNKKMIECLAIILDCPVEDIKPKRIEGNEGGDGANDSLVDGFFGFAPQGTAIKTIGGTPDLRKKFLGDSTLFFWQGLENSYYSKAVFKFGDLHDITMKSLAARITPMPEHYIPATPQEIVEELSLMDYDGTVNMARCLMPSDKINALFDGRPTKKKIIDDDEDEDDDGEGGL